MAIEFTPSLRSTDRVQVKQTQASDGTLTYKLTEPSAGASFGRGVLNIVSHVFFFIPGVKYTKNWHNPRQWEAFRNGILAMHPKDQLTEEKLDLILSTYSKHKRLTQGKASAVLDDVQRAVRGEPLQPRKLDRLNASQTPLARGFRTLKIIMGSWLKSEHELRRNVQGRSDPQANAIRDILRPGRTILNTSVTQGQTALEGLAAKLGVAFSVSGRGMDDAPLRFRLEQVLEAQREEGKDEINRLRQEALKHPDKPSLLSIPVILFPKAVSLHERHVVELAVDFRESKLLYLDAKGESIEQASRNYRHSDIADALKWFGKQLFGAGWSPETGIVQMTQAKQQGANDCGAFTHDFTRRLIEGQSVGDIERSFNAEDRRMLRIKMAEDIATIEPAGSGEGSENQLLIAPVVEAP